MPTLIEWEYEAGNEASIKERRGVQRIHFGDAVVDDYLGQGRGISLFLPLHSARTLKIEFIESSQKVVRAHLLPDERHQDVGALRFSWLLAPYCMSGVGAVRQVLAQCANGSWERCWRSAPTAPGRGVGAF